MHFSRYIRYWAHYRASEPAFVCGEERLSWREYADQCASLALALRDMGLEPGDRLGCLLPNSMQWCVAFGAAALAGAPLVPLNPGFGASELRAIVEDSDCKLVVSTAELMSRLGRPQRADDAAAVRVFRPGEPAAPAAASSAVDALRGNATLADLPAADLDEDAALVIGYTSGTTGLPKGAVLTHRGVAEVTHGLAHALDWTAGERFLVLAPLAFTGGVILNLASNVVTGGTAFIETRLVPDEVLAHIAERRISVAICVPVIWQRIAEAPAFAQADIRCLKSAITGGAPVSAALLKRYLDKGVVVRQAYGCTEAAGAIAMPDAASARARPGSCGRALVGIDLELRDLNGAPTAPGEVGEICVRGPQVMQAYWNNPKATADALAGGWYRTGDLARLDEGGALVIVDRKKSMIISGGVNVYPAEVERAMSAIDGVLEVAVFGVPSAEWGEQVVALVHGKALDSAVVGERARELLGSMKAPKQVLLATGPLPKTASNKIARHHLAALYAQLCSQGAA